MARPFIMKLAMQHFDSLVGGTALIATLVGLIATSIIASGFTISGAATWLVATVIVWITAVLAGVLLPAVFVKRRVQERRDDGGPRRIS